MERLPTEVLVGAVVQLRTTLGESIEGTVFALEPQAELLVLQEKSSAIPVAGRPRHNIRLLNVGSITDVQVVGRVDLDDKLPYVNVAKVKQREEKAITRAREAAARIGVSVTPEAQKIFDALSKTLPCVWRGEQILVMNEVLIVPPYKVESCSGENASTLARIRVVVRLHLAGCCLRGMPRVRVHVRG